MRTWAGWHRHITLAMLALAFPMAASAAPARCRSLAPRPHGGPIALTAAEIRRLFNALIITPLQTQMTLSLRTHQRHPALARWRRFHQGHARRSYYQRRYIAGPGP